jgi:hypothetical protein
MHSRQGTGPKHTDHPRLKHPLAQKYSYSPKSYNAFEKHGPLSMLNSGLGWNTIANVIAINWHLVKQPSHWRNKLMFAYRLSVFGSVAPPGMAWDAEGLRGNVANENKIIVLVGTTAWQVANRAGFAQVASAGSLEACFREANGYAPLETSRAHCCACQ